jgi:hypothetical protein
VIGSPEGDPTQPHARPPHTRALSGALLGYYLLDFALGSRLRLLPVRRDGGLVVLERGWWDMAVDPRRYRLSVSPAIVRALGWVLRRPDLTLVLEAPAEMLLARKPEISAEELTRQLQSWRTVLPAKCRRAHLDVTLPLPEVLDRARDEIERAHGDVLASAGSPGWTSFSPSASRWVIPRGPRAVALSGLSVYHPVTDRGLAGWVAARAVARAGGFRLLPRVGSPDVAVNEALAPYMPAGSVLSVARSNHEGRFLALIVGPSGHIHAVAKVALHAEGRRALEAEASALRSLAPLLEPPLGAPEILGEGPGVLLLEAVSWQPRPFAWRLPVEVAGSLGRFYRAGRTSGGAGPAHGDCAPWNLLRTTTGWSLVDWEDARQEGPPFFDLFHYIVQAQTLLGRPSPSAIRTGLLGKGPVGWATRAYAEEAGLSLSDAPEMFFSYLDGAWGRLTGGGARLRRRYEALTLAL